MFYNERNVSVRCNQWVREKSRGQSAKNQNTGQEGCSRIRHAHGQIGDDQDVTTGPLSKCKDGRRAPHRGPSCGSTLTSVSPHGVCQLSGSASSDFSEQQLGFFLSFGPSCHHRLGSGGKCVVRSEWRPLASPPLAWSVHSALLIVFTLLFAVTAALGATSAR